MIFMQITSINAVNTLCIGYEDMGSAYLIGPFGNLSSPIKISYVIGVHPAENKVHEFVKKTMLENSDKLKYQYYIYQIDHHNYNYERARVGGGHFDGYNTENGRMYRMEGQLLAQKYVLPIARDGDSKLIVDFHSNHANTDEDWAHYWSGGGYDVGNFLFASQSGNNRANSNSRYMAKYCLDHNNWGLLDWVPGSQTSPPYLINPLMDSGKTAFFYENYVREPNLEGYLRQFLLNNVDNIPSNEFK
jgi:hypothetical protein